VARRSRPPREVRKVVTVVFCDVAGFTATGERLDPEALRTLQSRYFDVELAARDARLDTQGSAWAVRARVAAMRGRCDDARDFIVSSKQIFADLGMRLFLRVGRRPTVPRSTSAKGRPLPKRNTAAGTTA
jgi:hypothetical protein